MLTPHPQERDGGLAAATLLPVAPGVTWTPPGRPSDAYSCPERTDYLGALFPLTLPSVPGSRGASPLGSRGLVAPSALPGRGRSLVPGERRRLRRSSPADAASQVALSSPTPGLQTFSEKKPTRESGMDIYTLPSIRQLVGSSRIAQGDQLRAL